MNEKQAIIRYVDGDFEIITAGTHVICAVTGKPIALEDLRYWSVDRQEAYIDAKASLQAEQQAQKK
ncbi:MAG: DUF2093 domain-containing protein [Parvibaculales bacterium]